MYSRENNEDTWDKGRPIERNDEVSQDEVFLLDKLVTQCHDWEYMRSFLDQRQGKEEFDEPVATVVLKGIFWGA